MKSEAFWENKGLHEFSEEEWESLCDGCARCCLIKLEDIDSGDLAFTNVACHLLDQETCQCKSYSERHIKVPDCIKVTPENSAELEWMPPTCAYRRLAEGKGLASWHPLISGTPQSVVDAGVSVKGRVVSEKGIPEKDLEDHLAMWPGLDVPGGGEGKE